MAVVTLPDDPGARVIGWEPVDFSVRMQGPLGGAAQQVNRLGNRWRLSVALPPMEAKDARNWAASLMQARRYGAKLYLLQPGTTTGTPGSPLVKGAGQSGDTLEIDGLTPAYAWKRAQWATITTGGRGYLYQLSATGIGDVAGEADLPLEPLLRVSPADNDPVEIARPWIEGHLLTPPGWNFDLDKMARGFEFQIEEAR